MTSVKQMSRKKYEIQQNHTSNAAGKKPTDQGVTFHIFYIAQEQNGKCHSHYTK